MRLFKKILRRILHDFVIVFSPPFLRRKMMKCREVSEILATHPNLTESKKFYLKLHLFICQCCTDYAHEIQIIEKTSKKAHSLTLTPEEAQKIKAASDQIIKSHSK